MFRITKSRYINADFIAALPIDEFLITRDVMILLMTIEAILFIFIINLPTILRYELNKHLKLSR